MAGDQIDFLVQETLNLLDSFKNMNPFDLEDFNFKEFRLEADKKVCVPPESSGIIYQLHKGPNFFSIDCVPVKNIQEYLQSQRDASFPLISSSTYAGLEEKTRYFATEYFALAEVLCDFLLHKKFPLSKNGMAEECWYLESCGPNRFAIQYSYSQENISADWKQLGPLGDRYVAKLRFQQLQQMLGDIEILCGNNSGEEQITFICPPEKSMQAQSIFKELQELFVRGEMPQAQLRQMSMRQGDSLYYFLQELAGMRRFWHKIQQEL